MSNVKLKNDLARAIATAVAGPLATLAGGAMEINCKLEQGKITVQVDSCPVDIIDHSSLDIKGPQGASYAYTLALGGGLDSDCTDEGKQIKAALRAIAEQVLQRRCRYWIYVSGQCMNEQVTRMRAERDRPSQASPVAVQAPSALGARAPASDLFATL